MVCFQTKNPNFGKILRALQWKILVSFMIIWSFSRPLETFYGHLIYFVVIWYISRRSGILYQEKSGNPALELFLCIRARLADECLLMIRRKPTAISVRMRPLISFLFHPNRKLFRQFPPFSASCNLDQFYRKTKREIEKINSVLNKQRFENKTYFGEITVKPH
jgi:hypothetical protein